MLGLSEFHFIKGHTYTAERLSKALFNAELVKHGVVKVDPYKTFAGPLDKAPAWLYFARVHGRWMQVGAKEKIVYIGDGKWKTKVNYKKV